MARLDTFEMNHQQQPELFTKSGCRIRSAYTYTGPPQQYSTKFHRKTGQYKTKTPKIQ